MKIAIVERQPVTVSCLRYTGPYGLPVVSSGAVRFPHGSPIKACSIVPVTV
jgi:hypothetical protein